ncbi:hypothetical protein HHI36_000634, partial [Cryptolaemus montrouzieri]
NERADKLAKAATNENNRKLDIEILPTCEETKTVLRIEILTNWNNRWKNQFPLKLHQIQQDVKQKNPALLFGRREQVIINRLRIGHTNITNLHLITKEDTEH